MRKREKVTRHFNILHWEVMSCWRKDEAINRQSSRLPHPIFRGVSTAIDEIRIEMSMPNANITSSK